MNVAECLEKGAGESCVSLTPRLLRAALVLIFWSERLDCLVGPDWERAWLEGPSAREPGRVVVSTWYSDEFGKSVPMEQVRLPGDVAARLEQVAREGRG